MIELSFISDGQITNQITNHISKSQMTLTKITSQIESLCQSNVTSSQFNEL